MSDPNKTVFISYRRSTSKYLARAIFMDLRVNGYDAFLDVNTIDSGAFDQIILNQIGACTHFIVLLSPGALERCASPGDWLRQEIEEAMRLGRNVVPIIEEGFNFEKETEVLSEAIRADFRRYNGMRLFHDFFDPAMDMLRTRFLQPPKVPVQIKATPAAEQRAVQQKVAEAASTPAPTKEQLSAEQYFNRANAKYEKGDYEGAIADYTEALRLNPQYALAYSNRGNALWKKGDYDGAIADYTEALRLNPQFADAYNNRGNARYFKNDLEGAIADYTEALRLNPQDAIAYSNRGSARRNKGDYDEAIADCTEALRLNPQYVNAYYNRGNARADKGDYDGAIADYTEALRLNSQYADAYRNRGVSYEKKGDFLQANIDYQKYIDLGGKDAEKAQGWIKVIEAKLKG